MKSKCEVVRVVATRWDKKKVEVIWEGESLELGLHQLYHESINSLEGVACLQLIERESTGILFVRVTVSMDCRPFCKTPESMGPDKYGYY
jgi:hypothetical protein